MRVNAKMQNVPTQIKARSFVLVDDSSMPRARLGLVLSTPALTLFDAQGKPRAVLGVATTANRVTGAKTTTQESTITLSNAEGTVLFQRP
jgi:hypothetical protein